MENLHTELTETKAFEANSIEELSRQIDLYIKKLQAGRVILKTNSSINKAGDTYLAIVTILATYNSKVGR